MNFSRRSKKNDSQWKPIFLTISLPTLSYITLILTVSESFSRVILFRCCNQGNGGEWAMLFQAEPAFSFFSSFCLERMSTRPGGVNGDHHWGWRHWVSFNMFGWSWCQNCVRPSYRNKLNQKVSRDFAPRLLKRVTWRKANFSEFTDVWWVNSCVRGRQSNTVWWRHLTSLNSAQTTVLYYKTIN